RGVRRYETSWHLQLEIIFAVLLRNMQSTRDKQAWLGKTRSINRKEPSVAKPQLKKKPGFHRRGAGHEKKSPFAKFSCCK
ncbi:MAG: hypothetical protein ACXWXL_08025, partial [Candidatus Binatia bacterium]